MQAMRGGALFLLGLIALSTAACGASESYKAASEASYRADSVQITAGASPEFKQTGHGTLALDDSKSTGPADEAKATPATAPARKIIFTGQISLVVADLSEFEKGLKAEVTKSGGYVSKIKEDRTYGDQRTGHWVLRVPANQFQGVIDALAELGVAQVRQIDSQDVTEEFFDLDARIATKKKLMERLDKLLAEKTGDVKDVLAVQNEIFRVQEELERMQGRLKYLADQTTLTTITVDAREDRNYEPPAAPTLSDKVAQSWTHSFTNLGQFGENLLLAVVALTPWLITGMILLGVPVIFFRWRRRSHRNSVIEARPA